MPRVYPSSATGPSSHSRVMRSSRLFSTVTRAARFTRGESAAGVQIAAARRRKVKVKIFGTYIFFMGEVLLTNDSVGGDVHLLELLVEHFVSRHHVRLLLRNSFGHGGVDLRLLQLLVCSTSRE